LRFKKEKEKENYGDMPLKNEIILAKKKPKGKMRFFQSKIRENEPP